MFTVISLFLAVSITMNSTLHIIIFLMYLINLYCVAGILCALGQTVMDSVLNFSCFLGFNFHGISLPSV